jgi:PKHD-type hydroxylase
MTNSVDFPSPSWSFRLDEIERFAFYENVFTPEDCAKIIDIGRSKSLYDGRIYSHGMQVVDPVIRDSKIVFLTPGADMDWVFRRLTDVVMQLNSQFFQFDLWGFTEHLQFTEYHAPGGKYEAHVDRTYKGVIRKLSIVLQLTDETEYEGGDFELLDGSLNTPTKLMRKQGTLLAFPSYTLHRVTPVTLGIRNSLVGWISGPQFK